MGVGGGGVGCGERCKLIIMICYLALLALYCLGSVLANVVRFTLGADLARFRFNYNSNYLTCAYKMNYRWHTIIDPPKTHQKTTTKTKNPQKKKENNKKTTKTKPQTSY